MPKNSTDKILGGYSEALRNSTIDWNLRRDLRRTMLFEKTLDHAIQIRIARAEASCEPGPAALRYFLPVSDHVELPGVPRFTNHFNVQTLLDLGHETRDLGLVVFSRWTVNDFYFHSGSILFAAISYLT